MTTQRYAVAESETTVPMAQRDVRALLFRPRAEGRFPLVVVGMEATGLNELIRELGRDLAARGYVAVVPDYYYGGGPADPEDLSDIEAIMPHLAALDFVDGTRCMHDAIASLTEQSFVDPARLAVWGLCTGATFSMLTASTRRDVGAAVLFYPSQPWHAELDLEHPVHPVDLLWNMACPMFLVYGDQDVVMPAEQLVEFKRRLDGWAIDYELTVPAGAGHAFMARAEGFFHAEAAEQCWPAAFEFLERHVPAGPAS